jgi:hypothetical protein
MPRFIEAIKLNAAYSTVGVVGPMWLDLDAITGFRLIQHVERHPPVFGADPKPDEEHEDAEVFYGAASIMVRFPNQRASYALRDLLPPSPMPEIKRW